MLHLLGAEGPFTYKHSSHRANVLFLSGYFQPHHFTGAIDGDPIPVESYIKRIGSITRALTPEEARVLSCDTHTVDPGQSLIHLALQRHSNHNVLVVLLSHQQQVKHDSCDALVIWSLTRE